MLARKRADAAEVSLAFVLASATIRADPNYCQTDDTAVVLDDLVEALIVEA